MARPLSTCPDCMQPIMHRLYERVKSKFIPHSYYCPNCGWHADKIP